VFTIFILCLFGLVFNPERGNTTFLRNIVEYLSDYTVSQKIVLFIVTAPRTSSLIRVGLESVRREAEKAPSSSQIGYHVTCKVSSPYKMSCFCPQFSEVGASLMNEPFGLRSRKN
jgi:hypothetical protein